MATYSNSVLTCTFDRNIINNDTQVFDLSNDYYILYAKGSGGKYYVYHLFYFLNMWCSLYNININKGTISGWSVLLVEETEVPGETTDFAQVTDSIGSCKSNYHTITASAAPILLCQRLRN